MSEATAPPPPNYDNRAGTVIAVSVFLMCVSTLFVGLRIYTRKVIKNEMGIDDYFAILTLFVILAEGIVTITATRVGLGQHIWMVSDTLTTFLMEFWLTIVFYTGGLLLVKLTFLFQYYRLMAVQKLRKVYVVAIIVVGLWGLSQLMIGIFMCKPVSGFWDLEGKAAGRVKCIPNFPQFYINAAGNIITDIAVFVLPLPVIARLNLPRSQKWLLFGIFSLGFFTVAISIIRIFYIGVHIDATWQNVNGQLWSLGELTSAIVCACLVTLRPLLSRVFPAIRAFAHRSSNGRRPSTDANSSDNPPGSGHSSDTHQRRGGSGGGSDDIECVTGMRPLGHTSSSESRKPLYDDDKASAAGHGNSSVEKRWHRSDGPSREVVGLPRKLPSAVLSDATERKMGLRTTVLTEVVPVAQHEIGRPGSIRVQREVLQTKRPESWYRTRDSGV